MGRALPARFQAGGVPGMVHSQIGRAGFAREQLPPVEHMGRIRRASNHQDIRARDMVVRHAAIRRQRRRSQPGGGYIVDVLQRPLRRTEQCKAGGAGRCGAQRRVSGRPAQVARHGQFARYVAQRVAAVLLYLRERFVLQVADLAAQQQPHGAEGQRDPKGQRHQ